MTVVRKKLWVLYGFVGWEVEGKLQFPFAEPFCGMTPYGLMG